LFPNLKIASIFLAIRMSPLQSLKFQGLKSLCETSDLVPVAPAFRRASA
jgi:hypothetical protein